MAPNNSSPSTYREGIIPLFSHLSIPKARRDRGMTADLATLFEQAGLRSTPSGPNGPSRPAALMWPAEVPQR